MHSSMLPPQEPCKGLLLNIIPTDIPRTAMPITAIVNNNSIIEFKSK